MSMHEEAQGWKGRPLSEYVNHLELQILDACQYVEMPIVMRTNFDPDGPVVGWRGLGMALEDALDELQQHRSMAHFVWWCWPLSLVFVATIGVLIR